MQAHPRAEVQLHAELPALHEKLHARQAEGVYGREEVSVYW